MNKRAFAIGFILLQCLLLVTASPFLLPPAIAAALCLMSWAPPLRFIGRVRTRNILLVLIAGFFIFATIASGVRFERSGMPIPPQMSISLAHFFLFVQVLECYWRRDDDRIANWMPTLGLGTVVCTLNRGMAADERSWFLWISVASAITFAVVFARLTQVQVKSATKVFRWRKGMIEATVLGIVLIAGAALGQAWETYGPNTQFWIVNQLVSAGGNQSEQTQHYSRQGGLHTILSEKRSRPKDVALSVRADDTPGYLRGRAFNNYSEGRWFQAQRVNRRFAWSRSGVSIYPTQSPPPSIKVTEGNSLFELRTGGKTPWQTMEIENDSRRGDVYFLPLETTHISGEGSRVNVSSLTNIESGLRTDKTYFAHVNRDLKSPPPIGDERYLLLMRPRDLERGVDQIAHDLLDDKPTTREKVAAVEAYFQNNYQYELMSTRTPRFRDPLSYFLLERPNAHCEWFASGAVALLRLAGVPCRYVTGYVVMDLSADRTHWVARNENAHAWVEAYDEQEQKWIVVEATPGMDVPEPGEAPLPEASIFDAPAQIASALGIDPSVFNLNWLRAIVDYFKQNSAAVLLGLLALISLVWVLFQVRRWNALRLTPAQRRLHRLDRRVRRKKFTRAPAETLHQFAARIRAANSPDQAWLNQAADWYTNYAECCYQDRQADVSLAALRVP